MNLRKFGSKTFLVGLSAALLVVAGSGWAQRDQEKGKEENKKSAPARPANRGGESKAAPEKSESRPQSNASRPANNEERNRGNERGNAENRGAQPANRPLANNETRNRENQPSNGRVEERGNRAPVNNAERNNGGRPGGIVNGNARASNGFGPTRTVSRGGFTAHVAGGGRVTTIRGNNIVVHNYGPRGARTIVATRPGGVRVVSYGAGAGFVEHPFVRGGVPYRTRTYVVGGRPYAHVFVGVSFRGGVYYHYIPPYRYAPAFYLWAWHPWAAPIRFSWGWGPWYGYSGYYFSPYPVYASANLWLTDYIIAQNLQAAYEAQQAEAANDAAAAANYPPPPPNPGAYSTPLSPELKQAIADEVAAQLAEQQAQQGQPSAAAPGAPPPLATPNSVPGALDPKIRTFIVNAGMNQTLTNGTECPLAPGDVLTRIDDTPDPQGNVHVLVSSSQANDCAAGSQMLMTAQSLQDMHNAFQEQMDNGLAQLSQNQGKNGIPAGPAASPTPVPDGTAQPDAGAAADLQQADQQGQQAQTQVQGADGQ